MIKSPDELIENGKLKPGIISSLRNVIGAQAMVSLMEPTHRKVAYAAIEKFKPVNVSATRGNKENNGQPITEFNELYLADDVLCEKLYEWYKTEMVKAGYLAANPEHDAYSSAETLVSESNNAFLKVMSNYTNIDTSNLWNMSKKQKILEIMTGLVLSIASTTKEESDLISG